MADANFWQRQIAEYEKEFNSWERRVDRIIKRYTDSARSNSSASRAARFNILWSNVQLLKPAVFARLPEPSVSRRFGDSDPVGRVAALILERALAYEITYYPDYRYALEYALLDWCLGGRGFAWVRYEPKFKALEAGENPDGLSITDRQQDEAEPESAEYTGQVIASECTPVDYVHWRDFGHSVARTWEEVTAVWRRVYMDRDALKERFGDELGSKIPLDTMPEELRSDSMSRDDGYQAVIYEIWDKSTSKVYWYSKGLTKIIDEKDDPLQLQGFWPCPRPLYATITTNSLKPVPDFALYQDQAEALDKLADRIDGLVDALKVRGVYDASIPALSRLFSEGANNALIPVDSWVGFAEKAGLKGAIDLIDVAPIAQALSYCYEAFEQQKQQIFEITGLSDILRGQSDPRETLGAQELKGQYGSLRLRERQDAFARFATDILRIKAEIICTTYQPETIAEISGANSLNPADLPLVPQALQLLKSEPSRVYRIEIASDSLIQVNEQQEQVSRIEFVKMVSGYIKEVAPLMNEAPELAPLLLEMLKFGVAGFKTGKTLEGIFDQLSDQVKQNASQPKPEKPDPEQIKAQASIQSEQIKAQNQMAIKQQEMQMQSQLDQHKAQLDAAERREDAALRMHVEQAKIDLESKKMLMEMDLKERMAQADRILKEKAMARKEVPENAPV